MSSMMGFLAGLVLLVAGGELLVRGASRLAGSFGISPLVIGLTVVSFGTSAPELAVSLQSVFNGQVDLATGNVVGSNIFNVLFILGLAAIITPLLVDRQLIRQEVPVMVGVSILLAVVAFDGSIGFIDGLMLFGLLLGYVTLTVWQSRRQKRDRQNGKRSLCAEANWRHHWLLQVIWILVGLVLLVFGADWLVKAAVNFARQLGLSEVIIGLTIVAAGTSLPEVAASIIAAVRGERDIAVGNVVGSNIFNILGVLGLSAIFAADGVAVAPALLVFDLPVMVVVAFACLPVFFTGNLIARWEGFLFVLAYAAYLAYLIMAAVRHDGLQTYSTAMLYFVGPAIALTLGVILTHEWQQRRRSTFNHD